MAELTSTGLAGTAPKSWPKVSSTDLAKPAIERLTPGSDAHNLVKDYILKRLNASENEMRRFHSRWRMNEMRHQAYINLPDYEKLLKAMTKAAAPPEIVSIVVPYSFATINTIVTYLVNAFTGRKPMFQLGTHKKESVEAAQYQEVVIQQNADHTRLVRHLYQFLNDGQLYGVSVLRTLWKNEKGLRTVYKTPPAMFGAAAAAKPTKSREMRLIYEGNDVSSIDPFMFFPDPRVPMTEVNRRGEYVFWRTYEGKHALLKAEAMGQLKYVENAGQLPKDSAPDSIRNIISTGDSSSGGRTRTPQNADYPIQVDQGTVELIPIELGLSAKRYPEKWLVTLLNKEQIVQMQPLDYDHDMHPVIVSEPYTTGYGFGQSGMADYLAPIQDSLSWFVNSHIYNVRASLNNMLIVDPSRIEIQDLKKPGPGKIIRVKNSAMGQDVQTMIKQLDVRDVTQSHINDLQLFMKIGDVMSAVNDNLRGQVEPGGRRTATESRTSLEAGMSRLASLARLISAQAMVDLGEQMSVNIMQLMTQEFYAQIVGEEGAMKAVNISPDMVVGDFYYPIHDGTLPIDKVALLDVWKEIFLGIMQDQQLRMSFDLVRLFEFVAQLGGAKNISQFRLQITPDQQAQQQLDAGNGVVPPGQIPPGGNGAMPPGMPAGVPTNGGPPPSA